MSWWQCRSRGGTGNIRILEPNCQPGTVKIVTPMPKRSLPGREVNRSIHASVSFVWLDITRYDHNYQGLLSPYVLSYYCLSRNSSVLSVPCYMCGKPGQAVVVVYPPFKKI